MSGLEEVKHNEEIVEEKINVTTTERIFALFLMMIVLFIVWIGVVFVFDVVIDKLIYVGSDYISVRHIIFGWSLIMSIGIGYLLIIMTQDKSIVNIIKKPFYWLKKLYNVMRGKDTLVSDGGDWYY